MAKRHPDQHRSKDTASPVDLWLPAVGNDERPDIMPEAPEYDQSAVPRAETQQALDTYQSVPKPVALRLELGGRLEACRDWLQRQLEQERRERAGFLWLPVLLGAGSVIYFTLPREPVPYAFPVLAVLVLAVCLATRNRPVVFVINLAVLTVACGVIAAQMRVAALSTPTLSRSHITEVSGTVIRREVRADQRVRYTLQVSRKSQHELLDHQHLQRLKLRITTKKGGELFQTGEQISGLAKIGPASGPAFPGGYDFGFNAWFAGLGGSGFYLRHPKRTELGATSVHSAGLGLRQLRDHVAADLRAGLSGQSGAIAAALIVGDRSGIDEQTNEALRRSGLAHILAISGLHMALVALNIVLVVRLGLALAPGVVLNWPVKKIAGVLALLGATLYLLLSGGSISTQRAYVMIAIMLTAVLLDRRALTMRNVAVAGLVILVLTPESVLQPGFQMSFSATAGLIAAYEETRKWRSNRALPPNTSMQLIRRARVAVFGLIFTPIIAGGATALFAAYHFHQIAPLGAVANAIAMPIVAFAVMPLALLTVMAMPFGLVDIVLPLLGRAIDSVVAVAQWVAGFEYASMGQVGTVHSGVLILGSLALVFAVLSRSKLRFLAVGLAGFALIA